MTEINDIIYSEYDNEEYSVDTIKKFIQDELSEPYSIFTYKHFFFNFKELSFVAKDKNNNLVGVITGYKKLKKEKNIGYIAMLVVDKNCRGKKIGLNLVKIILKKMEEIKIDIVILDVDYTNKVAMNLYDSKLIRFRFYKRKKIY